MTTSTTSGQKTAVAAPDAAGGGMSFISRAVLKGRFEPATSPACTRTRKEDPAGKGRVLS